MSTISVPRTETALGSGVSPFGAQITRDSVSQQAYVAICNSLMRSRLKPGQKLVARQVADELGISVTPVRESLLRLVSEHALALDDRGTVVVPVLTLERCIEICDLRMLIEGEGAARAAKLATSAEVDELLAIHDRYAKTETLSNYAVALTENENFHFGLCRLANSPALFRIVENLWMQFGPILSHLYDLKFPSFPWSETCPYPHHRSLAQTQPRPRAEGD